MPPLMSLPHTLKGTAMTYGIMSVATIMDDGEFLMLDRRESDKTGAVVEIWAQRSGTAPEGKAALRYVMPGGDMLRIVMFPNIDAAMDATWDVETFLGSPS